MCHLGTSTRVDQASYPPGNPTDELQMRQNLKKIMRISQNVRKITKIYEICTFMYQSAGSFILFLVDMEHPQENHQEIHQEIPQQDHPPFLNFYEKLS